MKPMSSARTSRTTASRRPTHRRLGIAVGTAVTLAATVIVSTPEAAHSAPRKPAPRIVFEGPAPGGTGQVFVTNARGTWQRRLTFGPNSAMEPRWSPFGRRILYLRRPPNDEHFPDLMVMGARGRHKQQLLAGGHRNFISDMAWAPGGRRLALVMSRSGAADDVYIFDMRTRHLTRLHANSVPDRYPATLDWSPDGSMIQLLCCGLHGKRRRRDARSRPVRHPSQRHRAATDHQHSPPRRMEPTLLTQREPARLLVQVR